MAWYRSHKKGSVAGKLWLLNPDDSDRAYAQSGSSPKCYMPYATKINNNVSSGFPQCGDRNTYDGSYVPVIYRNGYEVGSVFCITKIPKGKYKKLYVGCQVTAYGSGTYRHAEIKLCSNITFSSSSTPANVLKTVILASSDKTSAEINAQTGVTINSTDPLLLSAQTVEIDVSDLTQDFYFAFWNCDRTVTIRSIYLE